MKKHTAKHAHASCSGKLTLCTLVLSVICFMNPYMDQAGAQQQDLSPVEQQWQTFISMTPNRGIGPRDEVFGPIASNDTMTPLERDAMEFCVRFLDSLEMGQVENVYFIEEFRSPLSLQVSEVLDTGSFSALYRFGEPISNKDTVAFPLRLSGSGLDERIEYGTVFLRRVDRTWYIEQMTVFLEPFVQSSDN